MADARNHGLDRHTVVWLGLNLVEGFADGGQSMTPTPANDTFEYKFTGNGGMVYTFRSTRGGEIAIVCDIESDTHDRLERLHFADIQSRNIIGPIRHTNHVTKKTIVYSDARILVDPGELLGAESATVTWRWGYRDKSWEFGSAAGAVVP